MALITLAITVAIFWIAIKHGEPMSDDEAKASDEAYDDNPFLWPSNEDDFLDKKEK